ncbi:MAG: DUF2784 domain-containing protein [Pseudomonadota bacterium]
MNHPLLADGVVLVHFGFILFVVWGGFLALKWRWIPWLHLPAVFWGVIIEFTGWICPLTPLEIWLRTRAGDIGYDSGFVEHYLLPLIYPQGLTRGMQIMLGVSVLLLNVCIYAWLWRKHRRINEPLGGGKDINRWN